MDCTSLETFFSAISDRLLKLAVLLYFGNRVSTQSKVLNIDDLIGHLFDGLVFNAFFYFL